VLKGIDLEVKASESLVVIGGSGTGKSVLIKCIIGLIEPNPGSQVIIDGVDYTYSSLSQKGELLHHFGMLFQGGALFDSLKVWENIAFIAIKDKVLTKSQARDLAMEKLKMVELDERVLDLYPAELSGGMQKRVGLARAIANNPDIIFFDEPTSGLDPITSKVISNLINNLSRKLNALTITITHDMRCAQNIADRIAMIDQGKIAWLGTLEELNTTDNQLVKNFVGAA
jgi:phospholipid/cholesterol/gamma-HCH transport system ATP-binding protein